LIHVVHAYHVPFEGFVSPAPSARRESDHRREFRERANAGLAALLGRYEGSGVRWKKSVSAGDARALIYDEVIRIRADVVALGTHGRSGLAHVLVGSVAEWVLASAPCDALVARPARFSFELP
jgi:nucleotide-binding universal stress UspA family protein